MLSSATGPLIQSDDIAARAIGFCGDAAHIVRLAAAFQAMHQDQGPAGGTMGLPVAVPEQLSMGFGGKEP